MSEWSWDNFSLIFFIVIYFLGRIAKHTCLFIFVSTIAVIFLDFLSGRWQKEKKVGKILSLLQSMYDSTFRVQLDIRFWYEQNLA